MTSGHCTLMVDSVRSLSQSERRIALVCSAVRKSRFLSNKKCFIFHWKWLVVINLSGKIFGIESNYYIAEVEYREGEEEEDEEDEEVNSD